MQTEIRNRHGERLDYSLQGGGAHGGLAVLGHGVTANKDRPFLTALADGLAERGLAVLRLSFSGNGASEGCFEESTVSKEVEDLGAVLDAVGGPVAYVGHSMGAAVGVLRAAGDARVRWLVSLGGMIGTREFARRKFGHLVPGEGHMWDKPECPLSQRFLDDMEEIGSVLDAAARITVPWLLVHGGADDVVPPSDSVAAQRSAAGSAELVTLDGADHVFSGAATPAMVAAVVPWLVAQVHSA